MDGGQRDEPTFDVWRAIDGGDARLSNQRMQIQTPEMWLTEGNGPNGVRRDLTSAEFHQYTVGLTPELVELSGGRMGEHYVVHRTDAR